MKFIRTLKAENKNMSDLKVDIEDWFSEEADHFRSYTQLINWLKNGLKQENNKIVDKCINNLNIDSKYYNEVKNLIIEICKEYLYRYDEEK